MLLQKLYIEANVHVQKFYNSNFFGSILAISGLNRKRLFCLVWSVGHGAQMHGHHFGICYLDTSGSIRQNWPRGKCIKNWQCFFNTHDQTNNRKLYISQFIGQSHNTLYTLRQHKIKYLNAHSSLWESETSIWIWTRA